MFYHFGDHGLVVFFVADLDQHGAGGVHDRQGHHQRFPRAKPGMVFPRVQDRIAVVFAADLYRLKDLPGGGMDGPDRLRNARPESGLGKFVWDEFQNGSSNSLARIMVAVWTIGVIGFILDRLMVLLQKTVNFQK